MTIKERKAEYFKKAIIRAGFNYAKSCFESDKDDDEIPRLEDGRLNPHYLDISDATWEILNTSLDDYIELDASLFPQKSNMDYLFALMDELLEDEDEGDLFYEGEYKYIASQYGDNWETLYPDL